MLEGPFRGSDARAAGLVTTDQLGGPRFRRVFPDIYLPADLEPDAPTLARAAYLLVRDRAGALAGYSAAALLGADCAPSGAPAEVALPGSARPHPGLRTYRVTLAEADLTVVDGCRLTTPARTAWDLARRLPLGDAVVAVDALARQGGFEPSGLLARARREPGARGVRQVAAVVALAEPRSESEQETRLRVALVRGGLPVPAVQHVVVDESGFTLARVALAYPAARLALEYDGTPRLEVAGAVARPDARRARLDRLRDAELAEHGWRTLRFVAGDLDDLPRTVHRVRLVLAGLGVVPW